MLGLSSSVIAASVMIKFLSLFFLVYNTEAAKIPPFAVKYRPGSKKISQFSFFNIGSIDSASFLTVNVFSFLYLTPIPPPISKC